MANKQQQSDARLRTPSDYERELKAANEIVYKHSLELARLKKELEIANRQQENLLRFISHEVKGYMAKSEAAYAGIIQGDYGPVSELLERMVDNGLTDMRRGVDMVSDILDAANLRKGTVTYDKKSFDFEKTLQDVLRDSASAAKEKGLALESTIEPSEYSEYSLMGDEAKLRRHLIRNLVDNAIHYTPSGSITVSLARTPNAIRFSVKDTGIGITPEDMKNLFTEGGKGKESTKVNVDSTGYGLFIAKQVTEAHGGRIWAESAGKGKGSEFIVELPTT
ncbi:MAG: HAMP domain-containing sensor histidine kinase [Patescibacteria group bacterium]